ncbi:MAG: hypothetical protein ISP79_06550 [Methylophilaceae bacterium]|nr:hypothetical protein [Methylophilaceae bacterium]
MKQKKLRPAERLLRSIRGYVKNRSAITNISPTYRADKVLTLIERLSNIFKSNSYNKIYVENTMKEAWSLYEILQKSCEISQDNDEMDSNIIFLGNDFEKLIDIYYNENEVMNERKNKIF